MATFVSNGSAHLRHDSDGSGGGGGTSARVEADEASPPLPFLAGVDGVALRLGVEEPPGLAAAFLAMTLGFETGQRGRAKAFYRTEATRRHQRGVSNLKRGT